MLPELEEWSGFIMWWLSYFWQTWSQAVCIPMLSLYILGKLYFQSDTHTIGNNKQVDEEEKCKLLPHQLNTIPHTIIDLRRAEQELEVQRETR